MSQVEITVRGSHEVFAPAERATVRLQVGLEGPDSNDVYAGVTAVAGDVRTSIEQLHRPDSGPVTWWSSEQIQTWASRPWNKDGKQLPLVHHARVNFQVKFSDFTAMSPWITASVARKGASVAGIEWALTAAHRERLTSEVRAAVVRAATAKAQAYSDALGLGAVKVLAIADAGMLGEGLSPSAPQPAAFARMAATAAPAGDVQFAPNDIAVAADVDARYLVG